MFFPHARYCATRGAVGVVVEYRLVQPGRTSVEDSMADCRAALRHLREHAGEWDIDAGRIAVAGDSSGGHLAAALAVLPEAGQGGEDQAAMTSARPDALMLFCPVLDLERVTWLKPATLGEGPAGVAFTERRRALSPGRHVRAGLPPALLLHGRDDPTVPWEGSRDFAAAWVEAGNACDFEVLEGTRHAFVLTRWRTPEAQVVAALRRADTFLAGQGFLAGEATLTESSPPAW